jgi:hypothetical protein
MTRAPVFDARNGNLDFFLKTANAGMLRWSLSFKNPDVGVADSFKCKADSVRHAGRCVRAYAPFAKGSKSARAGHIEIRVHVAAKAVEALETGHTLHVSGPLTFQSVLGGTPTVHVESTTVRWPRKRSKRR